MIGQSSSLVSVILPTHNRMEYLKKAIESVLSQTYTNFELVVVDDASTDATKERITERQLHEPRLKPIVNQKNIGFVASLKRGVRASNGIYVARLDDDDFWCDPQKLEKQVRFLDAHPDHVLIGGGVIRINQDGKEISRELFPETDQEIRSVMLAYDPFVHTSVLFRRDAYERVGGYDETLDFSQDWDLWMKLASMGKTCNVPEYFVTYLQGTQNRSNKNLRHHLRLNLVVRKRNRRKFPNFWKGYIIGLISYAFSFLPFSFRLHPTFLAAKHFILRQI